MKRVDFKSSDLILLSIFFIFSGIGAAQGIQLSSQEISWIGEKVFENECASKDECLVEWNESEDFLSVGIAHFIWYPKACAGPFEESFVKFLNYAKASGKKIPCWLNAKPFSACPWNSREEFLSDQKKPKLQELRGFLKATKSQQAEFIVERLKDALPVMLEKAPKKDRQKISRQFNRLASISAGVYALVDYLNFKGLGIFDSERYKGKRCFDGSLRS